MEEDLVPGNGTGKRSRLLQSQGHPLGQTHRGQQRLRLVKKKKREKGKKKKKRSINYCPGCLWPSAGSRAAGAPVRRAEGLSTLDMAGSSCVEAGGPSGKAYLGRGKTLVVSEG